MSVNTELRGPVAELERTQALLELSQFQLERFQECYEKLLDYTKGLEEVLSPIYVIVL